MRQIDIENIYSYFMNVFGYRAILTTIAIQFYIRVRFRILPTDAILSLFMFIMSHINNRFQFVAYSPESSVIWKTIPGKIGGNPANEMTYSISTYSGYMNIFFYLGIMFVQRNVIFWLFEAGIVTTKAAAKCAYQILF